VTGRAKFRVNNLAVLIESKEGGREKRDKKSGRS